MLEEAGVIDHYVAVLNPSKVGVGHSLFARVWLRSQDAEMVDHFVAMMWELPQVVDCYNMLSDCDAMLRVVAADLDDYRQFQSAHLSRANGIERVKTDMSSQVVKQTYA